jgi:hypothetical protein
MTAGKDAVAQAVSVLRHFAMRIENRDIMLESNVLEALARFAVLDDIETLREVATCACLLTLSDIIRLPLVASSLMVPLVRLCGNEDVETARQACGAMANTAENKRTHKRLIEVGKLMHSMVFLMRSKHLSVHREAARCASNLLSSSGQ